MLTFGDLIKLFITMALFGLANPIGLKFLEKKMGRAAVEAYRAPKLKASDLQRCLTTGKRCNDFPVMR